MTLPLPTAPATKGKSQRSSAYFIDVDTAADPATPTWLRLFGIKSFAPDEATTLQENSDWDDVDENGLVWTSQIPTAKGWTCEITFSDKDYGTATFQQDPGQAALAERDGEQVHIRWYKRNGSGKVREGFAWVSWKETDANGLINATATLTGDGVLDKTEDASDLITP